MARGYARPTFLGRLWFAFGRLFVRRIKIRIVAGELLDEDVVGGGRHAEVLAAPAIGFHRFEDKGAADGGVLNPFHELKVELFGGFLFVAFETSFLDFNTAGIDVAAVHAGDVLGHEAQLFPFLFKFLGGLLVAIHYEIGVIEGEDAEEGLGRAPGSIGQVFGIGGEFALLFEELAVMEPVAVAAVFPFVDILTFKGATIKVLGQNGFDFRHLVEGAGKVFGGATVVEGEVDAVAEGAGEAGDFAVAVRVEVFKC